MINNIKAFSKFLDQPLLISKLNKTMPKIMTIGATGLLAKKTYDNFTKSQNKEEATKKTLKDAVILTSVVASSIVAPKIASKLTNRTPIESIEKIKERNKKLIEDFISSHNPDEKTKKILSKAKEKILSIKDIKKLISNSLASNENKKIVEKLIPSPENIKAKDIFSEIGYLSIYGAIPVACGIAGGIAGDCITKENSKENTTNKLNEGLYQYLANIFLCNIGAGAALGILEKLNIKSKSARAIGMTSGIVLTGVLGGSKIANLISKKVINPFLAPGQKLKERKPEALDMCLHTDDIATVSLLSGLKWIEPSLPILYSVSGYKSAVGYRN